MHCTDVYGYLHYTWTSRYIRRLLSISDWHEQELHPERSFHMKIHIYVHTCQSARSCILNPAFKTPSDINNSLVTDSDVHPFCFLSSNKTGNVLMSSKTEKEGTSKSLLRKLTLLSSFPTI